MLALIRNVIAIDYRGYGDSTGTPSEDGLLRDAQTVWDYVNAHAVSSGGDEEMEGKTVVVVGHSLGTAVTSRLVGSLADRGMCGVEVTKLSHLLIMLSSLGVNPKAVVLIAPFTSLPELLTT